MARYLSPLGNFMFAQHYPGHRGSQSTWPSMQDNLKLLEEYMKYFGTLKLQLKDNRQKRRRLIVTPLLRRWSFRPGFWTAPLRQHPATTTCGKRAFWNNVLLERKMKLDTPSPSLVLYSQTGPYSTSQPFASRSKLKQTLETISFLAWPYGSIAYKCPGDRIRPRKKCHARVPIPEVSQNPLWLHIIPNSKLHSLSKNATPSAIWGGLAGQKHSDAVWF